MENDKFKNLGGGATLLTARSVGFWGIRWGKLLRYYGTKALRSNSRVRNVGRLDKADRKAKRFDIMPKTNYNSNMMNYKSRNNNESEAHSKNLVPYCLSNLVSSQKAAFTLAEVLITLGIIGVVAAMTIPTLISKYQEKVLANHFKKSYAMINQALLSAQSQFGYIPQCYYEYGSSVSAISQDCGELTDKFLASLKIVKVCDGNSYEQGCIPEYRGVDDILKEEHEDDEDYDEEYWQDYADRNCGGFNTSNIRNRNKSYVLSDGTIIFFYDSFGCKIIGLDINGKKGPNKWGYDLFSLYINSDGNRFRYEGDICIGAEEGGRPFKQMYADVFH